MLEGILRGHFLQLLVALAEERPAGAGENEALHLSPVAAALQTLEKSGVLAVHGDDLCAVLLRCRHDKFTGAYQRFLVGEGNALALLNGGKGGGKSYAAHHGGHHRVGLLHRGGCQQPLGAGQHLHIQIGHTLPQFLRRRRVIKHRKARQKLPHLRF